MKKKLLATAFLVFTIVGVGVYKYRGTVQQFKMPEAVVKTAAVQEKSIPREFHAVATLSARSVEITPEIAGHIAQIKFKDGAEVKQGEILIQLDDAIYQSKYESAQAKLHYSKNNFARLSRLGKKGLVSQQALDQAEADLKERKADVDEALVMLEKMKLRAPYDGVVGKSRVNPGDYVNVGQKLVKLTDTKNLRIEYNVPEKFLPLLKVGQSVSITAAAYPDKTFSGALSFISPTINTDNRSISVYADIENKDNLLAAGMFVEASQSLGTTEHALMIPARSLVPVLDGAKVYTVVEGKAFEVKVTLGQRTEDAVQVVHGLSKSDIVITDGQLKVKTGMPVKIQS
jgi:membrane fusion protein (multidrug efflux system)